MENPVDVSKNSSESVDPETIPSTSRYGRARKPKNYFNDYYNTDEVVKNPQKRGTKSISPKTHKKAKPIGSDAFVHVTGDADVISEPVNMPLAETTEDNFDNFMKSVSGEIGNLKPAETSVKERKFFKSTQESKLQASTISYISKVSPKLPTKPVELPLENELIEPELDVNKVIKIVTKPTDIIEQSADSQKSQKGTVKTYGNKRKAFQIPGVFETFGLPDKPFLEADGSIVVSAKTKDIDAVIDTTDKNQINMDTNATINSNVTTFFGVKLSPEKPRDATLTDSIALPSPNKAPSKALITSVARIGKVQPTVTKIKSVVSSDSTKKLFASVSKLNTFTIVPKITKEQSSETTEETSPIKSPIQTGQSMDIDADMPTCKIKSITSVTDPQNINNNNQEKKFVKVIMDNSKILKVLPTSGGSPIKLPQDKNTSGESDKSDTSIGSLGSPPYSPIMTKIPTNHKVPIPSVIGISSPVKTNLFATSTSTPILVPDPAKTSPRIIASSKVFRKEYLTTSSPVKVIDVPAKSVSPGKIFESPIKTSPTTGEVVGRKRKQDLILRKDIEHSYSISPPRRKVLPVSPKKKFMARLKRNDSPKVNRERVKDAILENKKEIITQDIDLKDAPQKDEEILVTESEQESSKVEAETSNTDEDENLKQDKIEEATTLKADSLKVTSKISKAPKNLSDSSEEVRSKTPFAELNISPVVRLKQLQLDEDNQVIKSCESTLNVVNKRLDSVSKNVVRVSPRKGKGTNAFLWETNSGAFFVKQTAKAKASEVQIKEECDDLVNETSIVEVIESKRISDADNGSLIKKDDKGDLKVEISISPIEEDSDEEEIVKKSKASPISKDLIKKDEPDLEQSKKRKVLLKTRRVTRPIKTVPQKTKTIVNKSKGNKNQVKSAKDQTQLGQRQLRTRKFIFAEQITSTNRNTIARVLDKTPKPSKENVSTRLAKKKLFETRNNSRNVKRIEEDKVKQDESDNEPDVTEEKLGVDQESTLLVPEKRTRKKAQIEAVKVVEDEEAKERKALRKARQIRAAKLTEDVILVATRKKVIVIDSDDESESDIPIIRLVRRPVKSESDFVLKTEIKEEKVTPEKKTVTDTLNNRKRKRRGGRPRNYIKKLKLIDEEEQLPQKTAKYFRKRVKKVPMPIHSEAESNSKLDVDVKEEKVEEEKVENVSTEEKLAPAKMIRIKKERAVSTKYIEGDMVWAKVGCHPYWPAMITKDPTKNTIKQILKTNTSHSYHVRYFADNGRRSWVRATALMHYKNRNDLEILIDVSKPTFAKQYKVPKGKLALWELAVDELESIRHVQISDKLEFFIQALTQSAQRKKIVTPRTRGVKRGKPGVDLEDTLLNTSFKTLSSTRKIPIPIPEIKTPTSSRLSRLSSVDTLNKDSPRSHIDRFLQSQVEDKMSWKKHRSSRSIDDEQSQLKLESDIQRLKDFDTTDCSSSETDSIHSKVPVSGPIPCSIEYQDLLYKRNNLFRKVSRDKVCEICFKPKNVLSCQGPCAGFYHLDCANGYLDDSSQKICDTVSIKLSTKSYKKTTLNRLRNRAGKSDKSESNSGNSSDNDSKKSLKEKKTPKNVMNTFICGSCDRNDHCVCFVCAKEVSPLGDHSLTKCKVPKCGKAFHRDCTRLWPQVQWLDKQTPSTSGNIDGGQMVTSVICPRHVCHICISDDPKAAIARSGRSEALVRCLLCPATYHSFTGCVPAGTEIYTYSQIVCPRHLTLPNHVAGALSTSASSVLDGSPEAGMSTTPSHSKYFTKPPPPINTTWCLICSVGGDLVCCETCPTSVHEACSPINWMVDGSYVCEDCETGRLILYDEVVWAKLGAYRWWPALVLFPKEVPPNIRYMRHRRGEFIIKFFGTYDHFWMGHGRMFLYQEGDKGTIRMSGKNPKNMEVTFAKAMEEAAKAFALKRDFKKTMLRSDCRQPKNIKPPPYTRIRFNKPVGNVKVYDANVSITTPCSCDPKSDSPCGPDTHCLNRILWTECNPHNCPAGRRCQNQQFETRQYSPLVPCMTDGRGWGVKSLVPIVSGQFVIEYVGEVIEEQEYKRRVANMEKDLETNYYFLTIDSDRIIDAGPKGNAARFLNHSCDPNCETQKWTVNGDTRVGLFACTDIPANNELTFNYNLAPNGKTLLECKCKASTCSGFIGVKKAADNPKAKALPEKMLLKNKKRVGKSGYIRNMRLDRRCFICGKEGRLITCSNFGCSETYHIECVHLMNVPYAFWKCPRHYCKICQQKIVKRCKLCINSYCIQHCTMTNLGKGRIVEFVCPDHAVPPVTVKEETSKLIKENVKEETSQKKDEINKEAINDEKAASPIPKEDNRVDVDKKKSNRSKKMKSKPLKTVKKIVTKRKFTNKKRQTTNKKIKFQITTRHKSRRSR